MNITQLDEHLPTKFARHQIRKSRKNRKPIQNIEPPKPLADGDLRREFFSHITKLTSAEMATVAQQKVIEECMADGNKRPTDKDIEKACNKHVRRLLSA